MEDLRNKSRVTEVRVPQTNSSVDSVDSLDIRRELSDRGNRLIEFPQMKLKYKNQ
jgi:hypothetical protein